MTTDEISASGALWEAVRQAQARGEAGLQVAMLDADATESVWAGDDGLGGAVTESTLFPIFSVAKAVTATAVHLQAERSLLAYDEPVASYWPGFAAAGKGRITVRHVLSHRGGVPQVPDGLTLADACDWDVVVGRIAELEPRFPPGSTNAYHSLTFGWILGEVVRRTDPAQRPFAQFVEDELAQPLGVAGELYLSVPEHALGRVARLSIDPDTPAANAPELPLGSLPRPLALVPEHFNRADVRRACLPAVGGYASARGVARLFSMLAQGGALDDVRFLSEERVSSFLEPRDEAEVPDLVLGDFRLGWAGYHLRSPLLRDTGTLLCHPGAGGSLGWADLDRRHAGAICHNRMFGAVDGTHPYAEILAVAA